MLPPPAAPPPDPRPHRPSSRPAGEAPGPSRPTGRNLRPPRPVPPPPTQRPGALLAALVAARSGGGAMADRLTQLQDAVNSVRRALPSSLPDVRRSSCWRGGEAGAGPRPLLPPRPPPGPGRRLCEGVRPSPRRPPLAAPRAGSPRGGGCRYGGARPPSAGWAAAWGPLGCKIKWKRPS